MTSKLKVNILADGGDNAILTSDGSGSLTINNAALTNRFSFHAYRASNQSISSSTFTKVTFTNELFDPDGVFDLSNSRFKPTVLGKYLICASANISGGLDGSADSMDMYIYQYV